MAIKRLYAERSEFRVSPGRGSVKFKLYVEGDRGTEWRLEVWNKGPRVLGVRVGGCANERLVPEAPFTFPHMAAGVVCYPSPLPSEKVEVDVEVWDPQGWKPEATYRLFFTAYWADTGGVACPSVPPLRTYLPLFWSLLGGGKVDASRRCIPLRVAAGMGYWIYVEPVNDPYARYIGIFDGEVDDNLFWKHPDRYKVIVFETVSTRTLYELTAPSGTITVCISTSVGYWKVCLYGEVP